MGNDPSHLSEKIMTPGNPFLIYLETHRFLERSFLSAGGQIVPVYLKTDSSRALLPDFPGEIIRRNNTKIIKV